MAKPATPWLAKVQGNEQLTAEVKAIAEAQKAAAAPRMEAFRREWAERMARWDARKK